jgi:hypothetical protein
VCSVSVCTGLASRSQPLYDGVDNRPEHTEERRQGDIRHVASTNDLERVKYYARDGCKSCYPAVDQIKPDMRTSHWSYPSIQCRVRQELGLSPKCIPSVHKCMRATKGRPEYETFIQMIQTLRPKWPVCQHCARYVT